LLDGDAIYAPTMAGHRSKEGLNGLTKDVSWIDTL